MLPLLSFVVSLIVINKVPISIFFSLVICVKAFSAAPRGDELIYLPVGTNISLLFGLFTLITLNDRFVSIYIYNIIHSIILYWKNM